MQLTTIQRINFFWEELPADPELLPNSEGIVMIESETGQSRFLVGLHHLAIDSGYLLIGPAYADCVSPEEFPSLQAGAYYWGFRSEKYYALTPKVIQSVVNSLRSGKRLSLVDKWGRSRRLSRNDDYWEKLAWIAAGKQPEKM